MFVIFPLLAALLLFCCIFKKHRCGRSALIFAAIIWGVLVTLFTEALSLLSVLTVPTLTISWAAVALASLLSLIRIKRGAGAPASLTPPLIAVTAVVAIIVAVIALIALISPPNNVDSMVYHLSRVMHWIQNRSVAYYPTHILRQLYQRPWAEYAILHLQLLSGGDRFANLVQWFSMAGSVVGVSLIARRLGADLRAQVYAAAVAVTIPMGILQASGTQNDYVVSFWLVCFCYCLLLVFDELEGGARLFYSAAAGASLGLAILTKQTAYIYGLPFVIWFAARMFRSRAAFSNYLKPALIISALTISLNVIDSARNYQLFGTIFGSDDDRSVTLDTVSYRYTNESFTIKAFISNVARNLALHTVTSNRELFEISEQGLELLHNAIGQDIHDPRTSFGPLAFKPWLMGQISNENGAGNPLHLLLIVAAFCFCLWPRVPRERKIYVLALTCGFLLFCYVLKWQPWHSRLHLPLFVLWAPVVALMLVESNKQLIIVVTLAVLLSSSAIWVCYNKYRPLLGERSILEASRDELYFNEFAIEARGNYILAAQYLRAQQFRNIGLSLYGDELNRWEYLYWVLLDDGGALPRIEHIDVTNVSNRTGLAAFTPDAVVCSGCRAQDYQRYYQRYGPPKEFGFINIFGKKN